MKKKKIIFDPHRSANRGGLQDTDSVVLELENFLRPEQMEKLRALVDESSHHGVTEQGGDMSVNTDVRRSQVHSLSVEVYKGLYDGMLQLAKMVNVKYLFDLKMQVEHVQIASYDESDQGCYDWHMDWGRGTQGRRISISVPINNPDEYEGGQLEFNTSSEGTAVNQLMGKAVIFPSFLLHRVTPVTKGRRYSLVAWIH
ncbi:MAG: 2OG-Fe(II) oxygenase [Halioglobus sp.]